MHTHTLSYTHTHTLAHARTRTHMHTHTHTLSLSLSHTHTHTLAYMLEQASSPRVSGLVCIGVTGNSPNATCVYWCHMVLHVTVPEDCV